jgi:uncharacterized cupredoxin-like copper-binding protein
MAALLVVAGCSGAQQGQPDARITLKDFAIDVSSGTVTAGDVSLTVANEGPTIHEVEVFHLPDGVDLAALPVDGGVADTAGPGLTLVDEVEDIAPSTSTTLRVTLQPGRYALICNLPAHYQQGMHTTLVVE